MSKYTLHLSLQNTLFSLLISRAKNGYSLSLYLYKIVGLFDLRVITPPRPLALEGWPLDMLTSVVKLYQSIYSGKIAPSIGAIY